MKGKKKTLKTKAKSIAIAVNGKIIGHAKIMSKKESMERNAFWNSDY